MLNPHHDITLFEGNDYLGGHAKTELVRQEGVEYPLDQGFMVFNERNYPLFCRLLETLGVKKTGSEMSFSIKQLENNFEYKASHFFSWFAQKRNLLFWDHYKLFFELVRFKKILKKNFKAISHDLELKTFLIKNKFTKSFANKFILPLCSAIWSSNYKTILNFPVVLIYHFLDNHGILDLVNKTNWQCIEGGSRNYVSKMITSFKKKIFLSTPVHKIIRHQKGVEIVSGGKKRSQSRFDKVVLAVHSDQALKMIKDPTTLEREILEKIPYKNSKIFVHQDSGIMPKKKSAWASWNYLVSNEKEKDTLVTYNLAKIQRVVNKKNPFFISLNSENLINRDKILLRNDFAHPQFSAESEQFKKMYHLINGKNHTYYSGAYWFNGFHEDGFRSAVEVAKKLNIHF